MTDGPIGAIVAADRERLSQTGGPGSDSYRDEMLNIIARWEGYMAAGNRTRFYIEYAALVEGNPARYECKQALDHMD